MQPTTPAGFAEAVVTTADDRQRLKVEPDGRVYFDLIDGEEPVPCALTRDACNDLGRLADLPVPEPRDPNAIRLCFGTLGAMAGRFAFHFARDRRNAICCYRVSEAP